MGCRAAALLDKLNSTSSGGLDVENIETPDRAKACATQAEGCATQLWVIRYAAELGGETRNTSGRIRLSGVS